MAAQTNKSEHVLPDEKSTESKTSSRTVSHPSGLSTITGRTMTDRMPKILDVIGSRREITICGHIELIRRLPVRLTEHQQLIQQYIKEPGDYEGRYSAYSDSAAKLLDYGANYVALRLYDDITRPELGEFLLGKGWRMIGFATNRDANKTYIVEKWCNVRDH